MGYEAQLASRAQPLAALVPYLAIRRFAAQPGALEKLLWSRLREFGDQPHHYVIQTGPAHAPVWFLYADLPWDSEFFKLRMARLHAVLFDEDTTPAVLTAATVEFNQVLVANQIAHCYCEVAAKDPQLLYALGRTGWGVVESRLQYYHDSLDQLSGPRQPVRAARPDEAEVLRAVSANSRNLFDRFHADPVFTPAQADAFLGEYAAASARGFCDVVLVPDGPAVDSFLAVSYLREDAAVLDTKLGRVVLTAVGPENRGWHRHLVSETLWHTRERGGEAVLMTTQAANGAVVHNAQQLGFRLGELTHILSYQPSLSSR
jgi:dTDP-4-amino-4,6-dideoxy-D-galactose acyltransferase